MPPLWTQTLTWLIILLLLGLITPGDLDPLGRRLAHPLGAEKVLVALVPATASIAEALHRADLPLAEDGGNPITISSSKQLGQRMAQVGANAKLGLSGHPPVRMETMATARLYRHQGRAGSEWMAFLPAVLEEGTFYLADDPVQLIDAVGAELKLLQRHWRGGAAPLLLIPIAEGAFKANPDAFVQLGHQLTTGQLEGVAVQVASLAELKDQACWIDLPAQASAPPVAPMAPSTLLRASTS